VLDKIPKSVQPQVKSSFHDTYLAPTLDEANNIFDNAIEQFEAKYPKAMQCLTITCCHFMTFLLSMWQHIRLNNPIESAFATV